MHIDRGPEIDAFSEGLDALRREEFDLAVERLEAAEAVDPAEANLPAYLSSAYLASGRPNEARAAVDRALALDPDGFAPRLKAGELALRLGDMTRAEREFLAALRVAIPGSPEMTVARRWLAITRERLRGSVTRRALLPRLPRLAGLPRRIGRSRLTMEEERS
ncbi:MAG: Tetratricopeptide repeat [Chloroflexota bacterium]|nr:Tetratricopeptide repeat [Chloroflexota bacterium]